MRWFLPYSLLLLGCTIGGRKIVQEMDTGGPWIPGQDFVITQGDVKDREQVQGHFSAGYDPLLREELEEKFYKLSTRERRRYKKVSPYLKTDSEKIYFLELSPRERGDYVAARFPLLVKKARRPASISLPGKVKKESSHPDSYRVEKPIALNMSKGEVIKLWGRPFQVDIAGNPELENERWLFVRREGRQIVFFEGGRVQGWSLTE